VRIALPKGRLQIGVLELMAKSGLRFSFASDRDYRPVASEPGFEAKLVKVRAVPQLVALGNFSVGFCGLDLVREADYELVVPLLDLGLNPVQLVVAVRKGNEGIVDAPPKRPLLIATEYVSIADRWALERNLAHITVQSWGSTEAYAPEDADIVFDCSETGTTLAANGLVVLERLVKSSTYLVANRNALQEPASRAAIDALSARLRQALE